MASARILKILLGGLGGGLATGAATGLPVTFPIFTPDNSRDSLSLEQKKERGIRMTPDEVRATRYIEEAYKDMGYTGNVCVKFIPLVTFNPQNHPMTTNAFATRHNIGQAVTVTVSGTWTADEALYALAGRDAQHILNYHHDKTVGVLMGTFVGLYGGAIAKNIPYMALPAYVIGFLAYKASIRHYQSVADQVSGETLGTVNVLSKHIDASHPVPNTDDSNDGPSLFDDAIDVVSHYVGDEPSANKRCADLNALRSTKKPLLFSSPSRMAGIEEDVKNYSFKN